MGYNKLNMRVSYCGKRMTGPTACAGKAQSIVEFAVMGALIISILGVVINYGMRYNFQQQIAQQAFRKALAEASKDKPEGNPSGSSNYLVVRDRHIPNPADPFGMGDITPTQSGFSITRDYELHETADTLEELPHIVFDINGDKYRYLSAGFGDYCLTEECEGWQLKKYWEVYGAGNVWFPEEDDTTCLRVIDSCEGEIIDYEFCKRQCRMITDVAFCLRECRGGRPPGGGAQCGPICAAPIEVPEYCGALDGMFSFVIVGHEPGGMGVQADYSMDMTQDNVMDKGETPGGIATADSINWANTAHRTIIFKPYKSLSSVTQPVDSTVEQENAVEMEAPWD